MDFFCTKKWLEAAPLEIHTHSHTFVVHQAYTHVVLLHAKWKKFKWRKTRVIGGKREARFRCEIENVRGFKQEGKAKKIGIFLWSIKMSLEGISWAHTQKNVDISVMRAWNERIFWCSRYLSVCIWTTFHRFTYIRRCFFFVVIVLRFIRNVCKHNAIKLKTKQKSSLNDGKNIIVSM